MEERRTQSVYIRNIVFGAIDSLVSTVGLLAGIGVGALPAHTIVLTGVVYIFVEGFSMAMGSYLSEGAAEEYETRSKAHAKTTFTGALAMFVAFVLIGFVPILPYLFLSGLLAVLASVVVSLAALAIVAYFEARIASLPSGGRILRMVLLGGFAIIIGIVVGRIFGIS